MAQTRSTRSSKRSATTAFNNSDDNSINQNNEVEFNSEFPNTLYIKYSNTIHLKGSIQDLDSYIDSKEQSWKVVLCNNNKSIQVLTRSPVLETSNYNDNDENNEFSWTAGKIFNNNRLGLDNYERGQFAFLWPRSLCIDKSSEFHSLYVIDQQRTGTIRSFELESLQIKKIIHFPDNVNLDSIRYNESFGERFYGIYGQKVVVLNSNTGEFIQEIGTCYSRRLKREDNVMEDEHEITDQNNIIDQSEEKKVYMVGASSLVLANDNKIYVADNSAHDVKCYKRNPKDDSLSYLHSFNGHKQTTQSGEYIYTYRSKLLTNCPITYCADGPNDWQPYRLVYSAYHNALFVANDDNSISIFDCNNHQLLSNVKLHKDYKYPQDDPKNTVFIRGLTIAENQLLVASDSNVHIFNIMKKK